MSETPEAITEELPEEPEKAPGLVRRLLGKAKDPKVMRAVQLALITMASTSIKNMFEESFERLDALEAQKSAETGPSEAVGAAEIPEDVQGAVRAPLRAVAGNGAKEGDG